MVVLNIEITLLMQQMIGNAADQNSTYRQIRHMTKPIITPAADYSLVGCNTASGQQP
jgi:hypothetical protein